MVYIDVVLDFGASSKSHASLSDIENGFDFRLSHAKAKVLEHAVSWQDGLHTFGQIFFKSDVSQAA